MDLGIQMIVEIKGDSSTSKSLTDRVGAGLRTKHTDTRHFWVQERVQGDLSIKKVFTATNCADVGSKPASASVYTTALQMCRIAFLLTVDPTLHFKRMGHLLNRAGAGCVKLKEKDDCRNWLLWLMGAKLIEIPWNGGRVEHVAR